MNRKIIYVLAGETSRDANYRAQKILSLRDLFERMVLVTGGTGKDDEENIVVKPFPNPTGLLRVMRLLKIKSLLDKLYFPSRAIFYVKAAQRKLARIIEDDIRIGKKVCLIICVPPHDICLIGLFLKKRFPQIKLIIDWQDLWSYDENYLNKIPKVYRAKLYKLEKEIIQNSDINVTTNLYAKVAMEQYYNVPKHRVVSINHHFCREDYTEKAISGNCIDTLQRNIDIRIGFLGNLFKPPKVPGEEVLDAIRYVRERDLNVELHVYGDTTKSGIKYKKKSIEGLFLYERILHKDSLRKIAQCDFLLLLLADLPNCRATMHQKLPHYMLIGKPIIAIVPEPSAVADIVRETGSGYIISSNEQQWGERLYDIFMNDLKGVKRPSRNEKAIDAYDWVNISKQWTNVIDY